MSQTEAYKIVAEKSGFQRKQVKGAVDALMELAAEQVKKAVEVEASHKAREGVNPFAKEPCVFKAKPASKTVKVLALKKLKDVLN